MDISDVKKEIILLAQRVYNKSITEKCIVPEPVRVNTHWYYVCNLYDNDCELLLTTKKASNYKKSFELLLKSLQRKVAQNV